MAIGNYNVLIILKKTNFATQSQVVVFTAKGMMTEADPGQSPLLPLGNPSSENPQFKTLYEIRIDGRKVNPGLTLPKVGSELTVSALNDDSAFLAGIWRLNFEPSGNTGGSFNTIDHIVLKVVRI